MTRRVLRGVEVNDAALALDLIDQVGPGGEFTPCETDSGGWDRDPAWRLSWLARFGPTAGFTCGCAWRTLRGPRSHRRSRQT